MPVVEFDKLLSDISKNNLSPVYFLQGEEPYFIDGIAQAIEDKALQPHERDFNQHVLFGRDHQVGSVLQYAKKFPMFSDRQVVIVKEAQEIKDLGKEAGEKLLLAYINNPLASTILVFCYKGKTLDKRKALYKAIEGKAMVLNSLSIKDYQLPKWIQSEVEKLGSKISSDTATMLSEYLGNDLHRIVNEVKKIQENFKEKNVTITNELVQKYVGISKEYNIFELQRALSLRNAEKSYRIVQYFDANPKSSPLVMNIANLFSYFVKALKVHALQGSSDNEIASKLGVSPFFVKEYFALTKNYNYPKCVRIIQYIREADLASKGVGASNVDQGMILKELVHKILHA
jgi:DNA polymerase-3 subunit delta